MIPMHWASLEGVRVGKGGDGGRSSYGGKGLI